MIQHVAVDTHVVREFGNVGEDQLQNGVTQLNTTQHELPSLGVDVSG